MNAKHSLSLRMKVTILGTLVLICIAAGLTVVSILNVDQFFVKDMPNAISFRVKNAENPENIITVTPYSESASYTTVPIDSYNIASSVDKINAAVSDPESLDNLTVAMTTYSIKTRNHFAYISIMIMTVLMIAGAVLIYFITGKALKPVNELSRKIQIIDENNLSDELVCPSSTREIQQLTYSFNQMTKKLAHAFASQKYFASAAAHELKTPLSCIQTTIDVLQMDEHPENSDYRETITITKRNTERLIALVDSLLEMNSQNHEDMHESIVIESVVQAVIRDLMPQIKKKNLSVSVSCSGKMTGNKMLIGRALSNLVENAIKYTPSSGSISISDNTDGQVLMIHIADTGGGIPDKDKAHIFEPFYRVDESRSRSIAGSGLGLSIVQTIAQKHNGAVSVHDHTPCGTVFTLSFPVNELNSCASVCDVHR